MTDVAYGTKYQIRYFNYLMQSDCFAQRICLDIQIKLGILKVRPDRETYPPGSPLVKDFLKPLSQMALDLLSGEKACHLCKKAAHEDIFQDGFTLIEWSHSIFKTSTTDSRYDNLQHD